MNISYKVTCFHPSHILPWHVTVSNSALFAPPFYFYFLLSAGKDRRHETFPPLFYFYYIFFFILTRLVKTSQKEEVCHFSLTTNQQNITASSHWSYHLPLKGPRSTSSFFDTAEMKVVKRHQ